MPKYFINGVEVECTPQDAATLLKAMSGTNGNARASGEFRTLNSESYPDFVGRLHKNQKKLLRVLLDDKSTMTDKQLLKALGKEDNREIGGILAGISRHARKTGILLEAILGIETRHSEEGRAKLYTLTPEFRMCVLEQGFK